MEKPKLTLAVYGIGRMPLDRSNHYLELAELLSHRFRLSFIEVRNDIGKFSNPRSGEINRKTRNEPLFANAVKITRDFRDMEHKELLELSKQHNDVHNDYYISNSNLIQQLSMLREISIQIVKDQPNFVLSIRDDIAFDPGKIAQLCVTNIAADYFVTSVFHSNCGICERFIFGHSALTNKLMSRINLVSEYMLDSPYLRYPRTSGLNGEWLMRYAMDSEKAKVICAPIFTRRYRAHGGFAKELLTLRPSFILREGPSIFGFLRYLWLQVQNCQSYFRFNERL